MSTYAFGDEPVLGLGASTSRAFLHALAYKLHHAAYASVRVARRTIHTLRQTTSRIVGHIVERVSSLLGTVFQRGGLRACVSLLVTSGQIATYAAHAGYHHAVATTRRLVQAAHDHLEHIRSAPSRASAVGLTAGRLAAGLRDPRAGIAVLVASILLTGLIVARRWRHHPSTTATLPAAGETNGSVWVVSEQERERLAQGLYVVLGADGAVRVHGIPLTLDPDTRTGIAHTAAQAAEQRLEKLIARGRPLAELDMCTINIAARTAITRLLDDDLAA